MAHVDVESQVRHLKPQRYRGRDLSEALRRNALVPLAERLNPHELARLRGPIPLVETPRELAQLAHAFFPILDKAYFFNQLRRSMHASAPLRIIDDAVDAHRQKGYYDPRTRSVTLNARAPLDGGGGGGAAVGESHLSILLHEMLHAFLHAYRCVCTACRARAAAAAALRDKTDHGQTWAHAMSGLALSLQAEVRWRVDCGLELSVAYEMSRARWRPSERELLLWGLDMASLESVREQIDLRRKEAREARAEGQRPWGCCVQFLCANEA